MTNDLRYAFRILAQSPGFTALVVFTLALGIGATTTIFSLVNAVLLRPLPYLEPARLVMLWETNPKLQIAIREIPASAPSYLAWRRQSQGFERMAAFEANSFTLTGTAEPERVGGVRVSASLFPLLGVQPILGRAFREEEDQYGRDNVVMLSHSLWQRRFGSDAGVIGRAITLDGRSYTVVGVMPPGFHFPRAAEFASYFQFAPATHLWKPLALSPRETQNYGNHSYTVIARLKTGVRIEPAAAEMNAIERSLMGEAREEIHRSWGVLVVPFYEHVVRGARPALLVLMGATAFVLLIACVNVANLLLARSATRQKEIAIRAALGAERWRLVGQLLTESVLLALLGGLAGLLLAVWLLDLMAPLSAAAIPRLYELRVDGRILAFALLISLATGLAFGLGPALGSVRVDLNESLKEGAGRGTAGLGRRWGHRLLLVAEVALSLVLLVGAGLLIRSLAQLTAVQPGFRSDHVLTMQIVLPRAKYPEDFQRAAFFQQAVRRVAAVPGVECAAVISSLPLGGTDEGSTSTIEGQPPASPEEQPVLEFRSITSDYFRALSIPLKRGRLLTEHDMAGPPWVAVVNETMARRFWPAEDAIGKRFKRGHHAETPWNTVVGVVGDVRHTGLDQEPMPQAYTPYPQFWASAMTLVVRTALPEPARLTAAVTREIWEVDKDQPVTNIRTMQQVVFDSVSERRFHTLLLGAFAALALLLAALGIHGIVSQSVARRTREIGIRMALGARRHDALGLILRQAMAPVLVGAGFGLALAVALTRVLSGLLYGVSAWDAPTFGGVSLLLVAVALLAAYLPARRATRVDPAVTLKYE